MGALWLWSGHVAIMSAFWDKIAASKWTQLPFQSYIAKLNLTMTISLFATEQSNERAYLSFSSEVTILC